MLGLKKIAQDVYDNNLKVEVALWIAGSVLSLPDIDIFKNGIQDVLDGEPWAHSSMDIFKNIPTYIEDGDGFMEWCLQHKIYGFIVKVETPKPVKFINENSYDTFSFGYTKFTYIYVDDLSQVIPLAIEWRDKMIKQLYEENIS